MMSSLDLELARILQKSAQKHGITYKLADDILTKEIEMAHMSRRNGLQGELKKMIKDYAKEHKEELLEDEAK